MYIKNLVDEDFTNYKYPSMFIGTSKCDGKCFVDLGLPPETCHNYELMKSDSKIYIGINRLIDRYLENDITKAIVFGGLEPFDQFPDIFAFIYGLRRKYNCNDDIVIYTGYEEYEIQSYLDELRDMNFENIIIKFGRFIPNDKPIYDEILGVTLSSSNQYAIEFS